MELSDVIVGSCVIDCVSIAVGDVGMRRNASPTPFGKVEIIEATNKNAYVCKRFVWFIDELLCILFRIECPRCLLCVLRSRFL